jgi:pimeloyl-ACP methyl ester carboxylesterase
VIAPAQPPCDTLTEFFSGIDAILSAESIDRFAVCGSSWGGQVAQVAMLRYGDRVERAVLSSTGMSVGRFLSFVLKMYRRSITRKHPETVVANFRKRALKLLGESPEAEAFWTAVFDDLFEKTMSFDDYLTLINTQIDYVETYGPELVKYRFPNPVLILRARDETAGGGKMITALRRAYPHAEEYRFDAGGHHPALFHAVEYRRVIERFFTGDVME